MAAIICCTLELMFNQSSRSAVAHQVHFYQCQLKLSVMLVITFPHPAMPPAHIIVFTRLFVMQVAREAAEEVKEAVAAAGAKASAGDGGLDMFADNVDPDMFAGTPTRPQGTAPAKKALLDNYDDAEGYYNFQVCESCCCV